MSQELQKQIYDKAKALLFKPFIFTTDPEIPEATDLIKTALENGLEVNYVPVKGAPTLLCLALSVIPKQGTEKYELPNILLEAGADVNVQYTFQKWTPLLMAVEHEHDNKLVGKIIEKTKDINYITPQGDTALVRACLSYVCIRSENDRSRLNNGMANILSLVAAGADPNISASRWRGIGSNMAINEIDQKIAMYIERLREGTSKDLANYDYEL